MAGTEKKKKTIEETKTGRAGRKETGGTAGTSRKRGTSRAADTSGKKKTSKTADKAADVSKKKGNQGSRKKQPENLTPEQDSFMKTEVAILVTFAGSVLLFLSNFGLCGTVGDICRSVILGIFGMIGYPAPILLFIGICFYLSNRGNIRAIRKLSAVGLLLLMLCGLDQMMLGGGAQESWKLMEYYDAAAEGGGLIGGALSVLLTSLVGRVGAYVILFIGMVIAAVCITEKSLVNVVKRGSGRAYQYAREDMSRRREIHEERREEKRRLREEQRVRGVNLDATDLKDAPPMMHEFAAGIPAGTFTEPEKEKEIPVPETEWGRDVSAEMPEPSVSAESKEALQKEPMQEEINPADVFRGKIQMPEEASETFEPSEVSEPSAPSREPERLFDPADTRAEEDELLKKLYVRRDTRTVAELSGGELGSAVKTGPGYQEMRDVLDEISSVQAEEEDWIETDPSEPEPFKLEPFSVEQIEPESFEPETVEPESFESESMELEPEEVWEEAVLPEVPRKVSAEKKEPEAQYEKQIEKQLENKPEEKKEYVFPPLTLLKKGEGNHSGFSEQEYKETAIKLQQTLQNFGVGVTVTNISCGPTVTRYELHPEQGVKVSKIVALADDIKLNLAAADIRIEAPIPGKAAVGIEVPNKENSTVLLRDLLESDTFKRHDSRLAFAVGKDIGGQTVVSDIAKMPHLLIAGATGSGKSVCINTLIMSVIYKAKPDEVKLIMIDPKVVELSVYNGIPHLLIPVVTDPKKASGALNWAVAEMMDRYAKFAKYGVRDLKGFNAKVDSIQDIEDPKKPQKLPQIIIIVDELADLMMVAPSEVEDAICRLAQLARAAGIHLVIATQRPSVNVITGVIKANIPSRIAFSVSSGVDSRTIIDMVGAEKLLGKGDMLFYPSGYQKPQRVQGAFVSDQEVSAVVEFLTEQGMTAEYNAEIQSKIGAAQAADSGSASSERDAYFVQAGRFIIEKEKASIGMLQRMFKIGFNRAARIMDQLADAGVVGEEEGTKPRKVLMSMEQFENLLEQE